MPLWRNRDDPIVLGTAQAGAAMLTYMTAEPITACPTPQDLTQHRALLSQALPDPVDLPLVNELLAEAKTKGLSWIESLKYVIARRQFVVN